MLKLDDLLAAASFTAASVEAPNAWLGHLPFGGWVVQQVAPRILVELGTHSGNSYFSFCQSVVEARLSTRCYAVDTWEGDEHAGEYGETVFARVNAHHQERYAGFSRLLRMTFDEALGYFSDASIDLLHIDGLHTYEAVRHDFEMWLPKLAPGAVVLLHDTNVRERNFGVWRLWEELQDRYSNHIEFVHSHGLGVLQLNQPPAGREQGWLQGNADDHERLRTYFAALGARQLEVFGLNSELSGARKQVEEREQHGARLLQHTSNLGLEIAARDAQLADMRLHAQNLSLEVTSRDSQIAELREHTTNLGVEISRRDRQIEGLNLATAERDAQIADLRQHTTNLGLEVTARDAQIADLRQHATNLELEVARRDRQIESLNSATAERDAQIADLRQHATNLGLEIARRDDQIESLKLAASERDAQIADLRQHATNLELAASERDALVADLRQLATNLSIEVTQHEEQIADLRQHATNLSIEVTQREEQIADLRQHATNLSIEVTQREGQIAELRQHATNLGMEITARDKHLANLNQHASNLDREVISRESRIADLENTVGAGRQHVARLTQESHALQQSRSWRITAPLRWVSGRVRKPGPSDPPSE